MAIKRRGFVGALLTVPFIGKAALAEKAPPPFDLQAAKKAWRAYVAKMEDVAIQAMWKGEDVQAAMERYKKLHPPPPHANVKDHIKLAEAMASLKA